MRNRRTSPHPVSAFWPRAAIWNAPNQSCWWANPAPTRVIWPPAWPSPPAVNGGGCAFTTAAALVNQLVEAQREQGLSHMLARWSRVELIVIDELGYAPLAEVAAELLFQVIAERAEKAATIVTTNLPFSEWPQFFTMPVSARRCWYSGNLLNVF